MEIFNNYVKSIFNEISKGDATEVSYYDSLKSFLKDYGQIIGKKTSITVIPKQTEAGNPDFRIWDGKIKITGYIEAKDPTRVKNLDEIESSEQIKRYLEAFPNLLLTNFIEFRLYRNGSIWGKPVKISDYPITTRQLGKPTIYNIKEFTALLNFFFDFITPKISSSKILAEILANKASIMRDFVVKPTIENNQDNYFYWLYSSFKEHLIEDLELADFADLFSQTFTYGLFIAKYQFETQKTLFGKIVSELPFTTITAYDYIQKSFGLLREIFKVISTQDMPKELEIIVDDIVDILNNTDIYKLLGQSNTTGKRDPIFHLYETFLSKYDKEKKRKLGIFYTPLEVVSYIINSVNVLLKDKTLFNASDGLASYSNASNENPVTLLDPAVGTGTFLVYAIDLAIEEIKKRISSSPYYLNEFIKNHVLKNFYAFEILIAPYVVSHLKVLFRLTEENYSFKSNESPKIFLTNTLEFSQKEIKGFPGVFEQTLVSEQKNAYEVKNNIPILVVVGNPPYSVSSQNKVDPKTEFGKFYESYKENVRKEEKNIQPLSDDYIKFLAFAHYKINQTGKGIVAMITNNSFLDGIIHRDMRKKLLDDFDAIYILNLHGDIKRSKNNIYIKDENVFDITQGVSINIFVKTEKKQKEKVIYYGEIIGSREEKYKFLESYNVSNSKWIKLEPKKPYCFFILKDFKLYDIYNKFTQLSKIFNKYSTGIKTHRDYFIVTSRKEALFDNLNNFTDLRITDDEIWKNYNLKNTSDWNLKESRNKLITKGINTSLIKEYNYRIFNEHWLYYDKILVTRLRSEFMENLLLENIAIVTTKLLSSNNYKHAFISDKISDICFISNQGKESNYYFPLWLYKKENNNRKQETLSFEGEETLKISNIKKEIMSLLDNSFNKQIKVEEIFHYIYGILFSNIYREKYLEFLKIDFPKIPFTNNYELFNKISNLGQTLVDLHLLKSEILNNLTTKFEGIEGNGIIKNIKYDEATKRLYINEEQYFSNIGIDIYNYTIGSYQVLNKWLKDKKGQSLRIDDINYFRKIVKILEETIKTQNEIDKFYPEVEKELMHAN